MRKSYLWGRKTAWKWIRIPAAGYKIVGLPVSGFDRAHLMNNVKVMVRLAKSLRLARKTIREFKPDIAVGVGGYASGPTLWMAASQGDPALYRSKTRMPV